MMFILVVIQRPMIVLVRNSGYCEEVPGMILNRMYEPLIETDLIHLVPGIMVVFVVPFR